MMMLRRAAAGATRRCLSSSVTIEFPGAFSAHRMEAPEAKAVTSKEELIDYFKMMYTMRRMEITCDNEYKARTIRGFCHLYDGQEAIGTGIHNALTLEDSWITSYRCHCIMLARGGTVEGILAELMGNEAGETGGKGGSMHFYNKSQNFYGGQGIVGAQVPVGAGLAFANKYKTPPGEKMPVAIACYGDGAANQGQIAEAANMSMLWKLPMMFVIENNQYGMGTSNSRSSSNTEYYTMGNVIPGLKIDGMNVLSVREGMKYAKEYVSAGNGPLFIEFSTYRYHGHSMSDPGTTYRNRDEIAAMRATRDPIEHVKKMLLEFCSATDDELKAIEKDIRADVAAACDRAKASKPPPVSSLTDYIYLDDNGNNAPLPFIRMPAIQDSIGFAG
mmetsp:Transcript_2960/g.8948  ORF Transcript_2960/g.8948 Transcript_2960/m.8948 type:complete len:388 (-) Transcript_2960:347-1510(-)